MKKPITVTYDCYESIEKEVRNGGNSGRVFVPKSWAGRKVRILLMEPIEEGGEGRITLLHASISSI